MDVQPAPNGAETEITMEVDQTSTGKGHGGAMRIAEIQQQVGSGEYQVDINAVADVILRRLLAGKDQAGSSRPSDCESH